ADKVVDAAVKMRGEAELRYVPQGDNPWRDIAGRQAKDYEGQAGMYGGVALGPGGEQPGYGPRPGEAGGPDNRDPGSVRASDRPRPGPLPTADRRDGADRAHDPRRSGPSGVEPESVSQHNGEARRESALDRCCESGHEAGYERPSDPRLRWCTRQPACSQPHA